MSTWPIVQINEKDENVRTVQYLLNAHGAQLATDGIFGPLTKSAVTSFQTAHGLAPDGIVGNQTWPALLVQVQSGGAGPAVSAVQSQLHERVNQPTVDGSFGHQTNELVRAFQQNAGIAVDGIVGPITWNTIVTGHLAANTANEAALLVFQAWAAHDQVAAGRNASPAAVTELFARTFSPNDGWTANGCNVGAGSAFCEWIKPGGALVIQVNNNTGTPFYFATGATFT
jgi:peptidoglycan hydrolase-like protein with peptidoglycan-binding domain